MNSIDHWNCNFLHLECPNTSWLSEHIGLHNDCSFDAVSFPQWSEGTKMQCNVKEMLASSSLSCLLRSRFLERWSLRRRLPLMRVVLLRGSYKCSVLAVEKSPGRQLDVGVSTYGRFADFGGALWVPCGCPVERLDTNGCVLSYGHWKWVRIKMAIDLKRKRRLWSFFPGKGF